MKFRTTTAYPDPSSETPRYREASADESKLRAALAASQRRLDAAVARIESLLANDRLHADKVAALARAAAKAQRLAYRDELTGLPNRRLLKERFDQAVALAARNRQQVALLFLDIDGFKGINDRFGHAAGDSLLQQVAARLTECIRSSDTACRYGGDEFVILLPTIENEHGVTATAHKIRSILAPHYTIAGTEIEVHASIGTAVYPVHGRAYLELIEASDREMYQNKSSRSPHRLADHRNPLTGSSP
jgi:diguanylate cyclase (GGDEF)-like protein